MTSPSNSGAADDLNFDRAVPASEDSGAAPNQCANCSKPLGASYFTANGAPICASCRGKLELVAAPVREVGTLSKAAIFGFGGAVAGAIIWYAVLAITGWNIGLFAILSGWLVAKAMMAATGGRGGRVLQVSAALLTYVSVVMAFVPYAVQQIGDAADVESTAPVAGDSVAAGAGAAAAAGAATDDVAFGLTPDEINPLFALVILLGLSLAFPILMIFGDLPGSLISAAIFVFGMMQAWQMTAAPKLVFEGPFKLAGAPPARDGTSSPN